MRGLNSSDQAFIVYLRRERDRLAEELTKMTRERNKWFDAWKNHVSPQELPESLMKLLEQGEPE